MLTLVRARLDDTAPLDLDEVQREVVAHRGGVLRVLGAPGTGKTALAVEVVADRVGNGELTSDTCLVLTSSRRAAGALRERITARLGGTSSEPLARTHSAFGFGLLRRAAALAGEPTPRLLSGPEQDVVLAELLAGHAAGEAPGPAWPEHVRLAVGTRGFRAELRDLLMRAVELGLEPDDLAGLGHRHARPEWVAGAAVLREYDEVTALSSPGAYDPAWVLARAADLVLEDAETAAHLRRRVRLVVVDDAQELTPAALRLLRAVVGVAAPDVVLFGDPDAATQTFRGADPRILAHEWATLLTGPAAPDDGLFGPETLFGATSEAGTRTLALPTAYRTPEAVRSVCRRVTGHIGVTGEARHRQAAAGAPGGSVEVALLRSPAQEAAFVAGRLRAAHLLEGVSWSQMAVLVRGRARTAMLRRVLVANGVPVGAAEAELPVRDEVAVRPLLALLRVVARLVAEADREAGPDISAVLDPETAVDLLTSPLGGVDSVAMRRLRRTLRAVELEAGGSRTSDELLVAALLTPSTLPAEVGREGAAVRRLTRMVEAGCAAWLPGATAELVLWRMWEAGGLAARWRDVALLGGPAGSRADRDLDAVVALLGAAAAYADRLPGSGPAGFLDHVLGQDVPGDTLAARAPTGESVAMLTPASAAGRDWRVVVVAGVQEGVWPDPRLRGSLLGSHRLVDVVRGSEGGHRAALAAVRHDETRLFLVAVSRSSERLLVTAVRSEDEQPSPYLDAVDPRDVAAPRDFADPTRLLTLPALVAELRREVVGSDPARRGAAVTALARLARSGVAGADPARWWPLVGRSDDRPVRAPGQQVRVSPSRLDMHRRCALRSVLTACGGDGPAVGAADIGTLVHGIAHDLGDVDAARMAAEVDARWPLLGLPRGWLSDRKRSEARDMTARLATYLAAAEATGWRRVAAEQSMRVALGRVVLTGRVDRLEAGVDGSLRVVDLKTGSAKPRKDEVARHPQLGSYQLAVEQGAFSAHGSRGGGALLLHIGKGGGSAIAPKVTTMVQAQTPLAEDDDPGWAADLVTSVGEELAAPTTRATPGEWCQTCMLRACCPARPEGQTL